MNARRERSPLQRSPASGRGAWGATAPLRGRCCGLNRRRAGVILVLIASVYLYVHAVSPGAPSKGGGGAGGAVLTSGPYRERPGVPGARGLHDAAHLSKRRAGPPAKPTAARQPLLSRLVASLRAAPVAAPPPPPAPPPKTQDQLLQEAKLRWWEADGSPHMRTWEEKSMGDPAHRPERSPPGKRSYYLPWIKKDLAPWKLAGGITKEDVLNASALHFGYCAGDVVRFQILSGRLWVDFRTEREATGWYPMKNGPGNTSAKGRVPMVLFALLDLLRSFPGQIPDVDALVHTADFPCIKKSPDVQDYKRPKELVRERPTPMLGYNSAEGYWDIPFPDYSFFGHEHSWLTDPAGDLVMGWEKQADYLVAKYKGVPLWERVPQVMWRGRIQDPEHPNRDAIRRRLMECQVQLVAAGRQADAVAFNLRRPVIMLPDTGKFRYTLYVESMAYASNLRQKMATGSVVLAVRMHYYEWWSRALKPGVHFVEVSEGDDLCEDILAKVREIDRQLEASRSAADAAGAELSPRVAAWHQNFTESDVEGAASDIAAWLRVARVNATVDPNADEARGGSAADPMLSPAPTRNGSGDGAAAVDSEGASEAAGPEAAEGTARRRRRSLLRSTVESTASGARHWLLRFPEMLFRRTPGSDMPNSSSSERAAAWERGRHVRARRRLQQDWAANGPEGSESSGDSSNPLRAPTSGAGAASALGGLDRVPQGAVSVREPGLLSLLAAGGGPSDGGPGGGGADEAISGSRGPGAVSSSHDKTESTSGGVGAGTPGAQGTASVGHSGEAGSDEQLEGAAAEEVGSGGTNPGAAAERDEWHAAVAEPETAKPLPPPRPAPVLRDEEFEEEHDRLMALKPWTRTDSQEEQPDEWRHGQSWGTRFNPEEIADNAHQFLREHLRLEDVRLYTRDLLLEYAPLQRFTPFRSEGAVCMNWARMLAEFGFPHKAPNYDEDLLTSFYPYLKGSDIYDCSDEKKIPFFWECEALEKWQPAKRKRRLAQRCNLPYGKDAQKEWEATRHLQTPGAQVGY